MRIAPRPRSPPISASVSAPCASGWRGGERAASAALNDRSSAPARQRRLPPEQVAAIEALRRQRLTSPGIARRLGLPLSTVGCVLRRLGLGRLKSLDPPAQVVRYQRERPGELIHIDTKKLGRIAGIGHRITGRRSGMINRHRGIGWEYLHVAVDDASRLAYTEILPDERKPRAIAFLERALVWFARHGVTVERIMTDNGNAYRSHAFRAACTGAGVRHLRTKASTPRINGKAERFLLTVMRECAYARAFQSSQERAAALPRWLPTRFSSRSLVEADSGRAPAARGRARGGMPGRSEDGALQGEIGEVVLGPVRAGGGHRDLDPAHARCGPGRRA